MHYYYCSLSFFSFHRMTQSPLFTSLGITSKTSVTSTGADMMLTWNPHLCSLTIIRVLLEELFRLGMQVRALIILPFCVIGSEITDKISINSIRKTHDLIFLRGTIVECSLVIFERNDRSVLSLVEQHDQNTMY